MRRGLSIPLLCAALLAAGGCAATPRAGGNPDHLRAIRAANDRLETLYVAGDYAGVAAMYEDDAVLLGPGGYRVQGRRALDEYWAPRPDLPPPANPAWSLDIEWVEGVDSLLVQRGVSRLSRERDGERRESVVHFYVVWRRQEDGSYKIAVDAYWPPED